MRPRTVAVVATAVVAAVAAVTSYDHMRVLGERAGEGWKAFLIPLAVDGLVVSASTVLIARRRAGRAAGLLPWLAWLGGVGASVAANVAAAQPTTVGRLVALVPPLALAVSFELLRSLMAAAHPPTPAVAPVQAPVVAERLPELERAGEPEPEPIAPDLVSQAAEVLAEGRRNGKRVGRRTLARQLGVSEYEARRLVAQVAEVAT